jgi:hypothetical protein
MKIRKGWITQRRPIMSRENLERFIVPRQPKLDRITRRGEVVEKHQDREENLLDLKIIAASQKDEVVLDGTACVAVS